MSSWITFEWVFISWIISLVIHHHSVKRTAISSQKDNLIELIISLAEFKWLIDGDPSLYQEERYNARVARVSWKLKHLNQLASCSFLEEKDLTPLYTFDVESYVSTGTSQDEKCRLKYSLQEMCDDLVDKIDQSHFDKVTSSKMYIIWSARHTLFGVLFALTSIYLFLQIMSFFYS